MIGDCEVLKYRILQSLDGSPLGGHSGIQNTYRKVKQVFYWPQLKKYVWDYVMNCEVCKQCKHETVAHPSLLQPLAIPEHAWTNVTLDFVEGLPRSKGRDCILVVVD